MFNPLRTILWYRINYFSFPQSHSSQTGFLSEVKFLDQTSFSSLQLELNQKDFLSELKLLGQTSFSSLESHLSQRVLLSNVKFLDQLSFWAMLKMRVIFEIIGKMVHLNQNFFSFKKMNLTDLVKMTKSFICFQIFSHLLESWKYFLFGFQGQKSFWCWYLLQKYWLEFAFSLTNFGWYFLILSGRIGCLDLMTKLDFQTEIPEDSAFLETKASELDFIKVLDFHWQFDWTGKPVLFSPLFWLGIKDPEREDFRIYSQDCFYWMQEKQKDWVYRLTLIKE